MTELTPQMFVYDAWARGAGGSRRASRTRWRGRGRARPLRSGRPAPSAALNSTNACRHRRCATNSGVDAPMTSFSALHTQVGQVIRSARWRRVNSPEGVEVLERGGGAVHEHAAPQRPAGGWFGGQTRGDGRGRAAGPATIVAKARGQRARKTRQERVVEVVGAAVGDQRREPRLSARRARREVGAEAQADQRDPVGIDGRVLDREVEHRADDDFPVGSHTQVVLEQRGPLARPVEREHVVAARQGGRAGQQEELLARAVVALRVRITVARRPVVVGRGEEPAGEASRPRRGPGGVAPARRATRTPG